MREGLKKLLSILQEELMVYRKILSLAEEKTDVIIKGNVEELEKITEMEMGFISKIEEIDIKRQEELENLKLLGFNAENISDLLKFTEEEDSELLKKTRDEMVSVIERIRERNRLNSELIMQSLEFINYYINLMVNALYGPTGIYGKNGISRMESSILDTKV